MEVIGASEEVRTIEECRVTPSVPSPESALPLTLFDTFWFKFPPIQRIFYYPVPDLSRRLFDSTVVPTLKQSLSLTLSHFAPLAGKLVWPDHAAKPFIKYSAGDGVCLTVVESLCPDAFPRISGRAPHECAESRPYAPELPVTDLAAAPVAVRISLFHGHGFAIGLASHHAILDGKSVAMFTRCWSHLSKQLLAQSVCEVTEEMKPSLDRSLISDPDGLDLKYLQTRSEMSWGAVDPNCNDVGNHRRSMKLLPGLMPQRENLSRAAYAFSRDDIARLRVSVSGKLGNEGLSSFVLTYAYTLICIAKARGLGHSVMFCAMYMADCRGRGEGSIIPANYFGNCITYDAVVMEAGEMTGENGMVVVVERLRASVRGLVKGDGKAKLTEMLTMEMGEMEKVATGGSARLGLYERDFGWGKPAMVEMTSIEKTGAVSLAESRDGGGGVEVGLVMESDEMMVFDRVFTEGLSRL